VEGLEKAKARAKHIHSTVLTQSKLAGHNFAPTRTVSHEKHQQWSLDWLLLYVQSESVHFQHTKNVVEKIPEKNISKINRNNFHLSLKWPHTVTHPNTQAY